MGNKTMKPKLSYIIKKKEINVILEFPEKDSAEDKKRFIDLLKKDWINKFADFTVQDSKSALQSNSTRTEDK